MGEAVLLKNGAAHHREVKVTVRINEAGHKDRVAEVLNLACGHVARTPDGDDPTAIQMHHPVFDGRCAKRQYNASAKSLHLLRRKAGIIAGSTPVCRQFFEDLQIKQLR
jgi:hypothetical protein